MRTRGKCFLGESGRRSDDVRAGGSADLLAVQVVIVMRSLFDSSANVTMGN